MKDKRLKEHLVKTFFGNMEVRRKVTNLAENGSYSLLLEYVTEVYSKGLDTGCGCTKDLITIKDTFK